MSIARQHLQEEPRTFNGETYPLLARERRLEVELEPDFRLLIGRGDLEDARAHGAIVAAFPSHVTQKVARTTDVRRGLPPKSRSVRVWEPLGARLPDAGPLASAFVTPYIIAQVLKQPALQAELLHGRIRLEDGCE